MVTAQLCEFARINNIPASARYMMALSLLDWCACALGGRNEPVSRIIRDFAVTEAGVGQAQVIGEQTLVPMRMAALANGTISHALDFDDTHFAHIGHPSVAVIPAALAVAEHTEVSGADFLDAALIGAEVSIRIGVWLGRSHYQTGFHQTATAGAFGATLAAGRLLGLNRDQMGHAVGLVSTRASGQKSQFGTMGKPVNAGFAAANGVEAAQLALAGFKSDPKALETGHGFSDSHAGVQDRVAFDGIGRDWLFESISHKFHACCHGLHAMLEALSELLADIPQEQVAKIGIVTNPRWEPVCHIENPCTGLEAKFSYRFSAAMLASGVSTGIIQNFNNDLVAKPELVALQNRVSVQFDGDMPETAARVTLHLVDGSQKQRSHDLAEPIATSSREEKLLNKAQEMVGQDRADRLWAAIKGGLDLAGLRSTLWAPE